MRFWIGLFLGLIIGVCATAVYYEIWDSGADEIVSQVDDPITIPEPLLASHLKPPSGLRNGSRNQSIFQKMLPISAALSGA